MKRFLKTLIIVIIVGILIGIIGAVFYKKINDNKVVINESDNKLSNLKIDDLYKGRSGTINIYEKDQVKQCIKISNKLNSKNVVLVNENNDSEKVCSAPFATYMKASLFLVKNNAISQEINDEIKRINPETIYIIGSEYSISEDLKKNLSEKFNVKRIPGKNVYELSKNIANNMGDYSKVFITTLSQYKYNVVVSNIASRLKVPIVYVEKEHVPYSKLINKVEKENRYIIGGEDFIKNNIIEGVRFTYNSTSNLNSAINNYFLSNIDNTNDNLILVNKNSRDTMLIDGVLGQPILLCDDKLTDEDKEFLKKFSFKNIYVSGKIPREFVERVLNIKNKLKSGEIVFNKPKAVFFFSHQDDVILFAHSAIVNAVNKLGAENVEVVLVNSGNGSDVYNCIKLGRYKHIPKTMTLDEFVQARMNEFNAEMDTYGIPQNNRHYLMIPDSNTIKHTKEVKESIENFTKKGNYQFFTFSYFEEPQSDHKALGNVFRDMYYNQDINNVYYINKPQAYKHINKDIKISTNLINERDKEIVEEAIDCYCVPKYDKHLYEIGRLSVEDKFQLLQENVQKGGYIYGSIPGQKESIFH